MEIRDLETLGPLVAPSLRSDATAQGPRVSKSRTSMDSPYNLYLDCAKFELTNHIAYRVENKSLISTPRKLISTAGKLIFQVREYT